MPRRCRHMKYLRNPKPVKDLTISVRSPGQELYFKLVNINLIPVKTLENNSSGLIPDVEGHSGIFNGGVSESNYGAISQADFSTSGSRNYAIGFLTTNRPSD